MVVVLKVNLSLLELVFFQAVYANGRYCSAIGHCFQDVFCALLCCCKLFVTSLACYLLGLAASPSRWASHKRVHPSADGCRRFRFGMAKAKGREGKKSSGMKALYLAVAQN